jgi:hypothetical protein
VRNHFYPRWILANALAESVGLGATLLLGQSANTAIGDTPGAFTIVSAAVVAVLFGIVLEGMVVGWAQGFALRSRLPSLSVRDWTIATAVGAGIAWLLGMVPSTVISLHELGAPAEPAAGAAPPELAPWLQYSLAAGMGLVLGPVLAIAQVRVLKRHTPRPYGWLWANAIAWAVGMPIIFAGMDWVPWNAGRVSIALAILLVCGASGAAVGAIHGRYLQRAVTVPRTPTNAGHKSHESLQS